jgi:AcrR family transcriptional regulator
VLLAAEALLLEGGLSAVTMDRLSARTGVSKPTLYRTWPNAVALAFDVLLRRVSVMQPAPHGTDPLERLASHMMATAAQFQGTPTGRSIALMIAAAQSETELAKMFRNRFMSASQSVGRGLLQEAQAQGWIRPGLDLEVVADSLYAPLYYRLLVGHADLSPDFIRALFDLVMDGARATPGRPD